MFAKFWQPGRVKSRLAQSIGDTAAAQVYVALLNTLLKNLSRTADSRALVITPPESRAHFADFAGHAWQVVPQSGGDLGQRLSSWFSNELRRHSRAMIIGSDCVEVESGLIAAGMNALDDVDVVLGPTSDGGYWTIGMSHFHPELFCQIPWSTSKVFSATRTILEQHRISFRVLPTLSDVDTLEDLKALSARLRTRREAWTVDLAEALEQVGNECNRP